MSSSLSLANCKNKLCPWTNGKIKREALLFYQAAVMHFDGLIEKVTQPSTINILNSHCPWSNKKVSKDALTTYRSFKVGFCNPGCKDLFARAALSFHIEKETTVTEESKQNPPRKRQKVQESSNNKLSNVKSVERRCSWARDPVFHHYHDTEWGVPSRGDDRYLFEMLILEGAQAGLNWKTILNKRDNYKAAFDDFDVKKVASYDEERIAILLQNEGIIRNKLKVRSAVTNAQATLKICDEFGSFSAYLWQFVDNEPIVRSPSHYKDLPTTSPESDSLSKDLKKRGFKFVGSTIMYAFMQAVGMVDDHEHTCPQKKK